MAFRCHYVWQNFCQLLCCSNSNICHQGLSTFTHLFNIEAEILSSRHHFEILDHPFREIIMWGKKDYHWICSLANFTTFWDKARFSYLFRYKDPSDTSGHLLRENCNRENRLSLSPLDKLWWEKVLSLNLLPCGLYYLLWSPVLMHISLARTFWCLHLQTFPSHQNKQ